MATQAVRDDAHIPTIIEFIIDETGSMQSCKNNAVAGFNDFLVEQQNQANLCLFSLTKFDSRGQKTPYVDVDVNLVPQMQLNWFNPGGGTNLRDTIGQRIFATRNRIKDWKVKPNVLFVVLTDGMDNESREYSENIIKNTIETFSDWTFVYLGADQNALQIGGRLGFPEGNTKSFASAEIRETMQTLSSATTAYRASRSTTSEASRSFFQ